MKKAKLLLLTALSIIALNSRSQTIVADYDFSGGAATDISGNGHNGTLIGGITAAPGQGGVPNTALRFNGSTGCVSVPASSDFDLTQWTLLARVKFNGLYSALCQCSRLIDRAAVDDNSTDFMCLGVSDNRFDNSCNVFSPNNWEADGLSAGFGGTTLFSLTSYIDTTQWFCIAATYANDTVRTYLNGNLIRVYRRTSTYSFPSNSPLFIARHIDPNFPYWFNGVMDHATIWDGPLTQAQIQQACQSAPPCDVKDVMLCTRVFSAPFTYTFTADVIPAGSNLLWDFGDGSTAVGTGAVTHTYATGGTFKVCVYVLDSKGNRRCSRCFNMCIDQKSGARLYRHEDEKASAAAAAPQDLAVADPYPNPVSGELHVPVSVKQDEVVWLSLIGMDGTLIRRLQQSLAAGSNVMKLSLETLTPGTYLLKVEGTRGTVTKHFSKY